MIVRDINILRQQSEKVSSVEEAEDIISQLTKELSLHSNGIGLSAIQIGIAKQVSVISLGDKLITIINPEIIETEDEFVFTGEGCLSFPNRFANVKRFRHFVIKNQIIRDGKFEDETQYYYYPETSDSYQFVNPLVSIAVQHEIDHFYGKLIIDHLNSFKPDSIKISRNDPCPCGKIIDGKPIKYKKCCGK